MDEVARVVRVAVVVGEPLDRSALAAVLAADPRLRVPHVLGGCAPALVAAVLATARGQVVLDPGPREPAGGPDARPADPLASLTAARHGVLRLAAHGLSNRAVGRLLGLSPRSVENHLAAVYRALGVDRQEVNPRVAAVLAYRRWSRTG